MLALHQNRAAAVLSQSGRMNMHRVLAMTDLSHLPLVYCCCGYANQPSNQPSNPAGFLVMATETM